MSSVETTAQRPNPTQDPPPPVNIGGNVKTSASLAARRHGREFVRAFRALETPPETFDHRSHLRLAWALLQDLPVDTAINILTAALRGFAAHHGDHAKFNMTVTCTYTISIHERMSPGSAWQESFHNFCSRNPDLLIPVDQFMGQRYRNASWRSSTAKSTYLRPEPFSVDD